MWRRSNRGSSSWFVTFVTWFSAAGMGRQYRRRRISPFNRLREAPMTFRSQSPRDAVSVKAMGSKQNQWLRFIAATLARVEECFATFGEFMFPEFFVPTAKQAKRPDIVRFQARGPDTVRISLRNLQELDCAGKPQRAFLHPALDLPPKGTSRSQAAWNRARARRRRMR